MLLLSLCKSGNNLNDAQVALAYNQTAKVEGWPRITAGTVANFRAKEGLVAYAGSRGVREFKNNKAMQVKRSRPSGAMLFWVHDGWVAEFYYRTKDGYANRMNLEVVLDPCCNYPIGYAISTHENVNVIVEALGNAVRHARELFGERFIPYQIQSDNYARKATRPVYLATCTHYVPAAVGNAKAKVVEPYFKYLNTTYAQWMKNWSGFGVKSRREVQPSPEWLNANKESFPTEEEVVDQITKVIMLERAAKRDQYLEFWSKTEEQYKRVMDEELFLLTYGWTSGKGHVLEGSGLRVTIDGERLAYDSFDIAFREDAASKRWIVRYDPQDLSRVLAVSTDQKRRYILEQKYVQPMALADRKEGDAEQLQRVFDFNRRLEEHVAAKASRADEVAMAIFSKNTELDNTLAKTIITDSRGQHKDWVSRKRLAEAKAAAQEVKEVKPKGSKGGKGDFGGQSDRQKRMNKAQKGFRRMFINLGKRDGFYPGELMKTLNRYVGGRQEVGHIDLLDTISYFEVPEKDARKVAAQLTGIRFRGRTVRCNDEDEKAPRKERRQEGKKPQHKDRKQRPHKLKNS